MYKLIRNLSTARVILTVLCFGMVSAWSVPTLAEVSKAITPPPMQCVTDYSHMYSVAVANPGVINTPPPSVIYAESQYFAGVCGILYAGCVTGVFYTPVLNDVGVAVGFSYSGYCGRMTQAG